MTKQILNSPKNVRGNRKILLAMGQLIAAAVIAFNAGAQTSKDSPEFFLPESGKGPVIVVASGASGTTAYRKFASRLAALGYYVILVDGTTIYKRYPPQGFDGAANLKAVISESQTAVQAHSGKVALVGFSIGGAAVLVHGAQMKEHVAAAVAYYPAITSLGPSFNALATNLQVPVLVFAGEQDRYIDCCLIESMRALAGAPKAVPFELITYPNAEHGFNLEDTQFTFRTDDAQAAWEKTVLYLKSHLPARVQN
jgi:carboxymethylenebutenolidase